LSDKNFLNLALGRIVITGYHRSYHLLHATLMALTYLDPGVK